MPLLVTEAVVLHAFDYLESSRIVRLLTRDGGLRSGLAKGARRSQRRFGSGLDLFAQGTAFLHGKPGRELDTLSAFEDARARSALAADLERFTGAETIAEIALRFAPDDADVELFDAVTSALDTIAAASADHAREATLAGAWQIVAALGFAPTTDSCAECGATLAGEDALFSHPAGGVLCARCAQMAAGGRRLPDAARSAIAAWTSGQRTPELGDGASRAHQRLLREFLGYHVHDGRPLRAFELWENSSLSDVPRTTSDFRRPTSDVPSGSTTEPQVLPAEPVPAE
jgi:DNA repair protein RecO (recombination protein O)